MSEVPYRLDAGDDEAEREDRGRVPYQTCYKSILIPGSRYKFTTKISLLVQIYNALVRNVSTFCARRMVVAMGTVSTVVMMKNIASGRIAHSPPP